MSFVKLHYCRVRRPYHEVHLRHVSILQPLLSGMDQGPADALPSVLVCSGNIIQPPAVPVMPDHYTANDVALTILRHQHIRTATRYCETKVAPGIAVAYQQIARIPQRDDNGFVLWSRAANNQCHRNILIDPVVILQPSSGGCSLVRPRLFATTGKQQQTGGFPHTRDIRLNVRFPPKWRHDEILSYRPALGLRCPMRFADRPFPPATHGDIVIGARKFSPPGDLNLPHLPRQSPSTARRIDRCKNTCVIANIREDSRLALTP